MPGPSYEVDVDRYSSNDLETCDEVVIVNVEHRKGKRRKQRRREENSASNDDDVIILGCSSAAGQPQAVGTTTFSDSEDDAQVVRVELPLKRSRLYPCSSAQSTAGEVLFVREVQAQGVENDAPIGTTLLTSLDVQGGRLPEEDQQGHERGKKTSHSHEEVECGHKAEREGSVSPELPVCSFLPPSSTYQTSSGMEYISSLDILHSFPVVGISHRVERYQSNGTPLYWTDCTKCSSECTPNFHCVKVEAEAELDRVTEPLSRSEFCVTSVYRIQNMRLWKRYKCEMELMLDGGHFGYVLNQAWLYHVTSANVKTVCEEGLDPRLAREGCFGRGTYFSDNPVKCHQYSRPGSSQHMVLLCRVLLGDIKEYPRRHGDRSLRREPQKPNPMAGEKKTYDSVKGNISGHDEYVIYNPYRTLPEYVIEYTTPEPLGGPPLRHPVPGGGPRMLATAFQAAVNAVSSVPRYSQFFPPAHPSQYLPPSHFPPPPSYLPPPPPAVPLPPHYPQPPLPSMSWAAMRAQKKDGKTNNM